MYIKRYDTYYFIFLEQKLDILKKKDSVINELYEKLKELPYKLLCEALNNTRELFKLNEIADKKIKFLKEENEKLNSNITVNIFFFLYT